MVDRLPLIESRAVPGAARLPGVSVAAATAPDRALAGVGQAVTQLGGNLDVVRRRGEAREEQRQAEAERQEAKAAAEREKQRQNRIKGFNTEAVATLSEKWARDFQEAKQSAPSGATGFLDQFGGSLQEDVEQFVNQIPEDDQEGRQAVRDRLTRLRTTFIGPASGFEAAEQLRHRTEQTGKALNSLGNLAVSDPDQYRAYLSEGRQAIADSDLTAEGKDTARANLDESIGRAVIEVEIDDDPFGAKERLQEGEFDDLLTPEQKSRALGFAETAIVRRQQQEAAAQKTIEKQAKGAVDDAVFVLERGRVPDNLSEVTKLTTNAPEQSARLDEAIEDGQQIAAFNLLSPVERQSVVADISSQATASRRDIERLERFDKQHARLNQGMREDPVMTAVGTGLVDLPPVDPRDPATLQNRQRIADKIEVTYGVPTSGLTRDETKAMATQWLDMTTPQKIESMVGLEAGLGPERFRLALEDIAPEQPIAANAAAVAARAPGLASEMLEGQRLIDESGKNVLPAPTDYLATANDTLGAAMQHSGAGRQAAIDAALAIDVFRRSQTGSLTRDDFDADDFEQALLQSVGGVVEWNDGQIIPPIPNMDSDRFDDLMSSMNDTDLAQQAGGQLKWPTGGNVTMDDIRSHGVLESIGDAQYLVKVGDGYLIGPNGQTFELNMRELAPTLAGRISADDRQGIISGSLERLFGPGGGA
ncbi:MAG: hypothetical protein ACR2QF_02990 [Geminicoccaceae bacterium]